MKIAIYDTDVTDAQWTLLEPLLPKRKRRGRPPTCLRNVVNAIFYLVKSGCPWRLLPKSFPPCKTVHHHFRKWIRSGTWSALNDVLRAHIRSMHRKDCRPKAAILDSQTVRSDPHGGDVGYDAGKKTKGRKRFLLVDTLGMVLGVSVQPANTQERAGALALLALVLPVFTWLRKLWVDGGYAGPDFAEAAREHRPKLEVEVVKRGDDMEGFSVLPRRWIVERTFAWLVQHRRLVRDYERTDDSAIAWIHVAIIRIMLRRLA